jgi:hypothetical protein
MATNTYVALKTTTVTGSAVASVDFDFTGITGYTDLVVMANIKSTSTSYLQNRFNGDTGGTTNYSQTSLYGNGSSATSSRNSSAPTGYLAQNSNIDSTNFSPYTIQYNNYSNSTTYKTFLVRSGSASIETEAVIGTWRQTSAITAISYFLNTGNIAVGSIFTVYGIAAEGTSPAPKATGGAIYSDSTYYYHVFGSTGTFTPLSSLSADVLVVAGGGGAGANGSGGGGAGGLRLLASQSLTATGYTCTVGAGGANVYLTYGSNGGNSSFNSISVTGGGGGGGAGNGSLNAGQSGGSGGGTHRLGTAGSGNAGGYSPVEGYAGATGASGGGSNGGGGGGAGAAGTAGTSSNGGAGGLGASTYNSIPFSTWLTATGLGVSGTIAGGGGGGGSTTGGTSTGGGGNGGADNGNGTNGTASTGGGGGGGGQVNPTAATGGNGGSGVVIVRYAK